VANANASFAPCFCAAAYDVLNRSVDSATGQLSSTRLMLKRGTLPRWGKHVSVNCDAGVRKLAFVVLILHRALCTSFVTII